MEPTGTTYRTELAYEPYRHGHLAVYRIYVGETLTSEVFTLKSLGECLRLSPGATDSLYERRQLRHLATSVRGRPGRPLRGFPLSLLADVVLILETPGARANPRPQVQLAPVNSPAPGGALQPAAPFLKDDCPAGQFITLASIARQLGCSESSVKARLARANMMGVAVSTGATPAGGRPRKGWTDEHAEDLLRVFTEGHVREDLPVAHLTPPPAPDHDTFVSPMAEIVAEHDRLAAQRRAAGVAPVVPVDTFDTKAFARELTDEIEALTRNDVRENEGDTAWFRRPPDTGPRYMLQHYPRKPMADYWSERLAVEMNTYPEGSHPYIDVHKPPRPEHFDRAKAEIFRWGSARARKDPSFPPATLDGLEALRDAVMGHWWDYWSTCLAPGSPMMRVDMGEPGVVTDSLTDADHIDNAMRALSLGGTLADVDDLCGQLAMAGVGGASIATFRRDARAKVMQTADPE